MKLNRIKILLVLLIGVASTLGALCPKLFCAENFEISQNKDPSWLSKAVNSTLENIAGVFQRKSVELAARLREGKRLNLEIKNQFYDKHLRRIFVDFKGTGIFSGKLPFKFDLSDYYITSDGPIAYDLIIEKMSQEGGAIVFSFHGDLVVSLDKIIYELAKTTAQIVGAVAINQASNHILEFLQTADLGLFAKAVTQTFSKFSKETLAEGGANVLDNAIRVNNKKLAAFVREAITSGGMASFLTLAIIRSSSNAIASVVGASLGAMAGNLVAPGVGGVIGAFVGGLVLSDAVKVVVYELTVDFPIEISLKKIVKFQEILNSCNSDAISRAKVEKYSRFIFSKIKREVDWEEYKTLDIVINKVEKFPKEQRKCFVSIFQEVLELLRFRVIEKKDWYSSKKFYQVKQKISEWGLVELFPGF
ncbi:hypothetical protein HYY75_08880 [bacterium]|nr:hypothetical protein [bacterium]